MTNYPAIYAAADGYVDRIDYSFKVGTNGRYGVSLAIARNQATVYSFCYGIEPMIPEPAPNFYRRFILVAERQRVSKGDIIAYICICHREQASAAIFTSIFRPVTVVPL